jgi:CRP/FNR family transcriptional regulator, cyclic AMP receptor protein
MSPASLTAVLQTNSWMHSLGSRHLEALGAISSEVTWSAGQVVFREGDIDHRLYLILEGQVALDIHLPTRGRVTILTVGPQEVFGWSAAVPAVPKKTASARAVQPTRAISIDAAALQIVCELDCDLGYHVYRWLTNVIAERLKATRMQLLDMYAVDKG